MDGKKQQQATGASFVDELFGPKDRRDADSSAASSAASGGYFSTVFPPPSATARNDASRVAHGGDGKAAQGNGGGGYAATGMTSESPYFGPSSVHYGGRDFFYGAGHGQQDHRSHSETIPPPKKEDNKQQPDGSAATRGDWWQGTAAITIIIISRISLLLTERLYIQLIDVAIHRSIKPNCIQHI
ncbi:hypothetical protein EJB05_13627, partial [Eragrostis curvula]